MESPEARRQKIRPAFSSEDAAESWETHVTQLEINPPLTKRVEPIQETRQSKKAGRKINEEGGLLFRLSAGTNRPRSEEKGPHYTPIGRNSSADKSVGFGRRSLHLGVWEGFSDRGGSHHSFPLFQEKIWGTCQLPWSVLF